MAEESALYKKDRMRYNGLNRYTTGWLQKWRCFLICRHGGEAGSARFLKGRRPEDESREKRNLGMDSRDAGGAGCFLHMAAGARKKGQALIVLAGGALTAFSCMD